MSEEEIIKEAQYVLGCIQYEMQYDENPETNIRKQNARAIQGLLDLYNKQKKEIRRLKQNTMVLAKELDEQQEEINSLEEELELGNAITKAQFVSKDKIREIIESSSYPDFAIQKLEELLEEN